ncbi:MAG: glycosyltransferase family 2 protein [Muribaculaceae bacterium]|nr:glycosyltransferase family 2 protein [Muribaculaceae bacterium]
MLDLSVVILTYNEEIHISRCIRSVSSIARKVIVVDSESNDNTVKLATSLGAEVYTHKWPGNQAAQFNWALDNIPISTEWVLRLDADEYPSQELLAELNERLPEMDADTNGVLLPLKNIWMGKLLNRGGSKIKILRLFRYGYGRYESRMMDEHIEISDGNIIEFVNPFIDDNINNLSWWTNKHVGYAIREAVELLDLKYNISGGQSGNNLNKLSSEAKRRRELKLKYAKQPLFWRSFAYFIYRYFVKGGVFEGKEGFLRHFLQGWWYRTLVDANIFQIEKNTGGDPDKIKILLKQQYGIDFDENRS